MAPMAGRRCPRQRSPAWRRGRRTSGGRTGNGPGPPETPSPQTIMPIGLTAGHEDSIGKLVECGDSKVVDDAGNEVPPGTVGELGHAGANVVPGYWDNPAANAENFAGGYWKSGDLGSIDAEGFVRVFD